jgi:hypothetical protein
MKMTSRRGPWIAAIAAALIAAKAGIAQASAADAPAAPPPPIPVAHSALLTVNASVAPEGLVLHILHASNHIPIDGRDVTVTVDGKNQPLTVEPETGNFLLPTKDLGEGERQLDITVAHDGIRELLTGKVALPKTGGITASWDSSRKQMAWWVLNIAVVLIAVLAFSKRSSKPPEKDTDED